MAVDLEKYRKATTTKPVDLSKYKKVAQATPQAGLLGTKPNDSLYGKLIDNSVTRGIQKVIPGAQVGRAIGTLGGLGITAAKERLGMAPEGATAAFDTSAPSPLQVAGDVAKGAATVAGFKLPAAVGTTALRTVGKTALQTGALGALAGAGGAAQDTSGQTIPTASDAKQIAKGAAIGGATGAAIGGAVSGIGQIFQKAGDKIMNSVIKPSQADIKDGFSIETVKKYNLGGSLRTTLSKTESQMDNLTSQLNKKLAANNTKINLSGVLNRTAERINDPALGNKLSNFGSNSSMTKALDLLRAEIDEIADAGNLTITDAQTVKRAAGHYGAWTYGNVDPEATARQKLFNVFYNELKSEIENVSPSGVKAINKQLSELIPVLNAVIRRIPVAERNNILSLGDIIGLSAGAINPAALGGFAINLASKSGTAGNLLSKTGSGITRGAQPLGALGGGLTALASPAKQ